MAETAPRLDLALLNDEKHMYGHMEHHPIIKQFLTLLNARPDDLLKSTVKEAARMLGVSESHLQHLLREELNSSYTQLLRDVRARRAKALLLQHPEKTISEIAVACGYTSETMHRHFVKLFGHCPSHFRRNLR